jgi:hypothetical protein
MATSIDPEFFKKSSRVAIRQKFKGLLDEVKSAHGSIRGTAEQIGLSHTMLPLYVNAKKKEGKEKYNVPSADVLLAAILKWGWTIKIERTGGTPSWCEFGLIDMEGGIEQRIPEPAQMSLFDALTELDQQIDNLKKTVVRAEVEVSRALTQRRSA